MEELYQELHNRRAARRHSHQPFHNVQIRHEPVTLRSTGRSFAICHPMEPFCCSTSQAKAAVQHTLCTFAKPTARRPSVSVTDQRTHSLRMADGLWSPVLNQHPRRCFSTRPAPASRDKSHTTPSIINGELGFLTINGFCSWAMNAVNRCAFTFKIWPAVPPSRLRRQV